MAARKRSITVRLSEQEFEELESLTVLLERTRCNIFEPTFSDIIRHVIHESYTIGRQIYMEMREEGYYSDDDDYSKIVEECNSKSHKQEGHSEECQCDDCLPFWGDEECISYL